MIFILYKLYILTPKPTHHRKCQTHTHIRAHTHTLSIHSINSRCVVSFWRCKTFRLGNTLEYGSFVNE